MDYTLIAISYLLGSIPFGLVLGKLLGGKDVREAGSGNIGATNVTRLLGKKLGALTLILDAAKGASAVVIASHFTENSDIILICAAASVLGHIFPIWLKFKGGKGVATTLAVLLALYWPAGIFFISIWIITFLFARISAVSAIAAMIFTPAFLFFMKDEVGINMVYLSVFLSILVVAKHHSNIRKLLGKQ